MPSSCCHHGAVHHSAITDSSLIQYRQVIRSSEHNKAEAIVKQLVTQVAKNFRLISRAIKGAIETFKVFCTKTAYDVIVFKFHEDTWPPCSHAGAYTWTLSRLASALEWPPRTRVTTANPSDHHVDALEWLAIFWKARHSRLQHQKFATSLVFILKPDTFKRAARISHD